MNERLGTIVKRLSAGASNGSEIGTLSAGERCFVALAANRYELLPVTYADPIEAWLRLEPEWRLGVCEWRGWPEHYAIG